MEVRSSASVLAVGKEIHGQSFVLADGSKFSRGEDWRGPRGYRGERGYTGNTGPQGSSGIGLDRLGSYATKRDTSYYQLGVGFVHTGHGQNFTFIAHSGDYCISYDNYVNTSYLLIDGNVKQSLKEVVEELGLGTVERKEFPLCEGSIKKNEELKAQGETEGMALPSGEWVLKDNYFLQLKVKVQEQEKQLKSLQQEIQSGKLKAQINKKGKT
jgi:hypothetical protein